MSCTTCGSNTPCRCSTCSDTSSSCQSALPATQLPFYACAPACPETHSQRLVLQQFYSTISVQNTWNVPGCGEQSTIVVIGLKSANPGSYIWNSEYGYFEIVSFDSSTGQVVIQNNCNEGNAAAGTNVPSCTEFNVTVPPCECPADINICVAVDFTAPDNGDCIDITLTTTQGLTASDTVQIGSGFYFVSALKPNDIITICNQGQGITPGTPVIAKDANDNYQYCLGIVSTNACDRDADPVLVLLGCNEDGISGPLECDTPGWVPTSITTVNGAEVACRPLGFDDNCQNLTAALALSTGVATYTNISVGDSTTFVVGDVVEFAGTGGWSLEITNIPSGVLLDGTIIPTPGFDTSIPNGTLLCLGSCCDRVQAELEALPFSGAGDFILDATEHTIDAGTPTFTGTTDTFNLVNPSSTKSMLVVLNFVAFCTGAASIPTPGPAYATAQLVIDYFVDASHEQAATFTTEWLDSDEDAAYLAITVSETRAITVAPGATVVITYGPIVNWVAQTGTLPDIAQFVFNSTEIRYSYIGVPIP